MKRSLAAGLAAIILAAGSAGAATVAGVSSVTSNPDGTLSFLFDEPVQTDVVGTGMGLTFDSGTGLTLTATGSGIVRRICRRRMPALASTAACRATIWKKVNGVPSPSTRPLISKASR